MTILASIFYFSKYSLPSLEVYDIWIILISWIFSFLWLYTGIKAFKYSSVWISRSINNVRVLVAFLFGFLIYDETLSLLQVIGGLFIVISVILFTLSKDTRIDISIKGIALSVISGFFVWWTFMSIAYLARSFNVEASILFFQSATLLVSTIYIIGKLALKQEIEIKIQNSKVFLLLIIQWIISFANYYFYALTSQLGNLAVISIVMWSNIVIISILSYLIFGEKISKKSIYYMLICGLWVAIIWYSRL